MRTSESAKCLEHDGCLGQILSTFGVAVLLLGAGGSVGHAYSGADQSNWPTGSSGNPEVMDGAACASCHDSPVSEDLEDNGGPFSILGPTMALGGTLLDQLYSVSLALGNEDQTACGFNVSLSSGAGTFQGDSDPQDPEVPRVHTNVNEITQNETTGTCNQFLFSWLSATVSEPTNVRLYGAGLHADEDMTVEGDVPFIQSRTVTLVPSAQVLQNDLVTPESKQAIPEPPGSGSGNCGEPDRCKDLVVSPDGEHVYAVTNQGVFEFSTAGEGPPASIGGDLNIAGFSLAISPDGQHVYVGGGLGVGERGRANELVPYSRAPEDGALARLDEQIQFTSPYEGISDVAVNASSTKVYVTTDDKNDIGGGGAEGLLVYEWVDDELTLEEVITTGHGFGPLEDLFLTSQPRAVVSYGGTPETAEHIYVVGHTTTGSLEGRRGQVTVLERRDPDSLEIIQSFEDRIGGMVGIGGFAGAVDVSVSPDGAHVYVLSSRGNASEPAHLTVFRRGSDGMLAFVEAIEDGAAGFDGLQVPRAIQSEGSFVFVASGEASTDAEIAVFQQSGGSGYLAQLTAQDVRQAPKDTDFPISLALSPTDDRIYALYDDEAGASLAVFRFVPEPSMSLLQLAALGSLLALQLRNRRSVRA